jgi:tetratricopeptide (TPR) repeat protein
MLYEEFDFMAFKYRYRRNTNAIEQAKVDYTKKYKTYNEYNSVVFCRASTKYYYDRSNVSEFLKSIQSCLDNNEHFEEKIDKINNYSWQVFKSTDDIDLLKKVLNWSAKRLRKSNNALYLDTYANLLYKLGQTNKAMKYEAKAINLATGKYIEKFKSTLLKMQQNEKTW